MTKQKAIRLESAEARVIKNRGDIKQEIVYANEESGTASRKGA